MVVREEKHNNVNVPDQGRPWPIPWLQEPPTLYPVSLGPSGEARSALGIENQQVQREVCCGVESSTLLLNGAERATGACTRSIQGGRDPGPLFVGAEGDLGSYRLTGTRPDSVPNGKVAAERAICDRQNAHKLKHTCPGITQSDWKLIREWRLYLCATSGLHLNFNGINWEKVNQVKVTIPYIHRWHETYRKSLLAKLYLVEAWYNKNPVPYTMITETTRNMWMLSKDKTQVVFNSKGYCLDDAMRILLEADQKVRNMLRKDMGPIPYLRFMEPHKTGFAHIHKVYFGIVPDTLQDRITRLYDEAYHAGSKEHGIQFDCDPGGKLTSVKNYAIKYLGKSLWWEESPYFELFNAKLKQHRVRAFTASQDLSQIMKMQKEDTGVTWMNTELENSDGDKQEIYYNHEGYARLNASRAFSGLPVKVDPFDQVNPSLGYAQRISKLPGLKKLQARWQPNQEVITWE